MLEKLTSFYSLWLGKKIYNKKKPVSVPRQVEVLIYGELHSVNSVFPLNFLQKHCFVEPCRGLEIGYSLNCIGFPLTPCQIGFRFWVIDKWILLQLEAHREPWHRKLEMYLLC